MTEQEVNKTLIRYCESAVAKEGGEAVDARNSQGQVNKPSGQVVQHFGDNFYVGQLNIYRSQQESQELSTSTTYTSRNPNSFESSLRPYLRVIDVQDKTISQYKDVVEKRIKREVDRAIHLIDEHQLKRAISLLKRVQDEEFSDLPNPDEVTPSLRESVYRLLGLCYLRVGDFNAALENVETAKSIIPESEQLDRAFLEYYIATGNHELAAQIAHKLLSVDPTCVEVHNAFAVIQLETKDFKAVIETYQDLPSADQNPSAQSILFFAYMQLGKLPLALEKACKFVELEPKLPYAHETLGNAYFALAYASAGKQQEIRADWLRLIIDKKNLNRAIGCYQQALTLYDNLEQPYASEALRINLTSALTGVGRLTDALKTVNENLENVSDLHVTNFELKAQIEEELGEADNALDTCLRAVQLFPDDFRSLINFGGLYLNQKRPDEAREWLERAERRCTDSKDLSFVQVVRSKTYLLQNDREGAWACLQNIPATEKDNIEADLAFGDYFSHFKNHLEAERYYRKALSKEPHDLEVLNKVIGFYLAVQQVEKAIVYAQRFAELTNAPLAHAAYAQLLLEDGRPSKALSALQMAIKQGLETSADYKVLEAMCRQQLRQFREAIMLYEEVLQSEPDNFPVVYNLALCHARIGQRPEAIQALVQAETLRPDEVLVHTALSQLYQIEGQGEKAYSYAKKALACERDNPDMYLFFFNVARFCGYEEEAAKVLMQVPKRFPEYQNLKVLPEEKAKQIIVSSRQEYDQVQHFYQSGNLPLSLVAKWLGKPLPLLWRIFSHDEEAKILSAFGNYAEQQNSYLAADQVSRVVIDYSALITLYYSGLMDLPKRLFDRVYIPQGTFDQIQVDILRLTQFVSTSRVNRLKSIRQLIYQHPKFQRQSERLEKSLILDAQQREIIGAYIEQDILLAKQNDAVYLLDDPRILGSVEQVLPDRVVTTRGLLDYLLQGGKLRKADYQAACEYLDKTHRPQCCDCSKLEEFCCVVINFVSLGILHDINLLDLALNEFAVVHVSQPTLMLLNQGIGELEFYRNTLEAVKSIDSIIKKDEVCVIQAASSIENMDTASDEDAVLDEYFVETFALSKELQLPLWTDDLASRRLAMASTSAQVATFDTRTALDVALNQEKITRDVFGETVLNLLRWNYHFVHVNAAIIYWAIEQHNFHTNEDVDLLLNALDDSISNAYQRVSTLEREMGNSINLEGQTDLFFSNMHVYADLLLTLWHEIPPARKYFRSKWADIIFNRVTKVVPEPRLGIRFLMLVCLSNMLRDFSNEQLDHFLTFCASPFTLPSAEAVDECILLILESLYRQGNYDEDNLYVAARLLNNIRAAQHWRVMREFRKRASEDFFKAVQTNRQIVNEHDV